MTEQRDDETETDFRLIDATRTMTKETLVDGDVPAVLVVREPSAVVAVDIAATDVDLDLRPGTPTASGTESQPASEDQTLVDPVRALPDATSTRTTTTPAGSVPVVRRFQVSNSES